MATGHLVTYLQFTLDGYIYLDHLDDARRQVVATLQLLDLIIENLFYDVNLLIRVFRVPVHLFPHALVIRNRYFVPAINMECGLNASSVIALPLTITTFAILAFNLDRCGFADKQFFQLPDSRSADDTDLILLVLAQLDFLSLFDDSVRASLSDPFGRRFWHR